MVVGVGGDAVSLSVVGVTFENTDENCWFSACALVNICIIMVGYFLIVINALSSYSMWNILGLCLGWKGQ